MNGSGNRGGLKGSGSRNVKRPGRPRGSTSCGHRGCVLTRCDVGPGCCPSSGDHACHQHASKTQSRPHRRDRSLPRHRWPSSHLTASSLQGAPTRTPGALVVRAPSFQRTGLGFHPRGAEQTPHKLHLKTGGFLVSGIPGVWPSRSAQCPCDPLELVLGHRPLSPSPGPDVRVVRSF